MTVQQIIEELNKLPLDAVVKAYEGESEGLVITKDGAQIGFIPTD